LTDKLVYGEEVFAIVGAAIEVHKQLGPGFLESVYQEAMEIELSARNIPFGPQQEMYIQYKGQILNKYYVADFICYDKIVVELKALDQLTGKAQAQVINYLKASDMRVGVLINFGGKGRLEWQRFVN
jgi:GxxExxY protein